MLTYERVTSHTRKTKPSRRHRHERRPKLSETTTTKREARLTPLRPVSGGVLSDSGASVVSVASGSSRVLLLDRKSSKKRTGRGSERQSSAEERTSVRGEYVYIPAEITELGHSVRLESRSDYHHHHTDGEKHKKTIDSASTPSKSPARTPEVVYTPPRRDNDATSEMQEQLTSHFQAMRTNEID